MQYYTTLDYFSRLYDKVGRQHGADLSSKEAYEAWKLDINRRLRDTVGLDLCEPAPANPRLLDIKEFETFTREHWLIQTEPLVEMPFFLLKPKKPHNGGLILNPHGHGGGKENNVADPENPWVQEMQKKFGEKPSFAQELAEAGYYVACPDARGTGERREKWEQGEEPENWRSNSHREINQMAVGFGILPDIKAIKTMIRVRAVYQPTPQNAEVYNRIFPVFKALYKNNKKAYAALNGAGPRKQEEKI